MLIWISLYALCLFPNLTNRNCNEGKGEIKPRDSIRPSYLNSSMRVSQLSTCIAWYRNLRIRKIWLPVLNEVSDWDTVDTQLNDVNNIWIKHTATGFSVRWFVCVSLKSPY